MHVLGRHRLCTSTEPALHNNAGHAYRHAARGFVGGSQCRVRPAAGPPPVVCRLWTICIGFGVHASRHDFWGSMVDALMAGGAAHMAWLFSRNGVRDELGVCRKWGAV